MPGPVPSALGSLARSDDEGSVEEGERLLADLLEAYRARLPNAVASFRAEVDGKEVPSLLDAFADESVAFRQVRLVFADSPPTTPTWEYVRPVREVEIGPDGAASVTLQGELRPVRAIARLLLREHYPTAALAGVPRAEGDGLPTFPALSTILRKHRIAPFQLALLLYFPDERCRYELDLIAGHLLADRRPGRLPIDRRVHRSARVSHGIDLLVARGEMALGNARALEVLFDTHGLSDVELARVLGTSRELARSALENLVSRHLASYDGRLRIFKPRLDAFLTAADRRRSAEGAGPRLPPMPDPALRTSVMELLAAADSRATCPLCGDPLPPDHRNILCDACQAEVGGSIGEREPE